MSDPIQDLEDLKHGGITVNPMPAAEVRRRGTRLRRRNNALAAAGALAVVLVVATPIAVVARGGDHADDLPIAPSITPTPTTQTSWRQSIPDTFDLTALPGGATFRFQPKAGSVVDDFTLCGTPTFSTRSDDPVAAAVDTAGATYGESGTDGSSGRTLALYDNDEVAAKVVDAVRHGVRSCPTDRQPGQAPLVYAPVDTELPTEDSFVFTQQAQMDKDLLSDLTVFQVARVGNAVYLASDHTTAGGPQVVDSQVQHLSTLSAPVLGDMCVFAAEPCDASALPGDDETTTAAVTAIPDDFPLLDGLPEAATVKFGQPGRFGPSRTVDTMGLTGCGGRTLDTPDHVDFMRGWWRSPAEERGRQLVTFAGSAQAEAYVAAVRELNACGVEHLSGGVGRVHVVSTPTALGDQAVVAVTYYDDGGGTTPGFRVTEAVRVGNAVVLSDRIDDGETTPLTDGLAEQLASDSSDRLGAVVEAMQAFSGA